MTFTPKYGLNEYQAERMISEPWIADYFERVACWVMLHEVKQGRPPVLDDKMKKIIISLMEMYIKKVKEARRLI